MPMLRFVVGLSPAYAAGTCILAVFFTTLGGTYRHYKLGNVNTRSILPIIISGAVATIISSLAFLYLSRQERWLDLALGVIFSLVSLRMIAEGIPGLIRENKNERADNEIRGTVRKKVFLGTLAGVLPGLLGVGTGVILVPAFTYLLNAPIRAAIAASLTCFSVNAFISSAFKYRQGFIDLDVASVICLGTLLGANLGAILNKRVSSRTLKFVFGLVFSYVSLKFILLYFEVRI